MTELDSLLIAALSYGCVLTMLIFVAVFCIVAIVFVVVRGRDAIKRIMEP